MKPLTTQAVPLFFNESGVNTMKEEWRPVVGYEGIYEVSSLGRVRSLDRIDCLKHNRKGKPRIPTPSPAGYLVLYFSKNGSHSKKTLHSVVARAFLGERPEGYGIDHLDGDKLNNAASNLEYVTFAENTRRHYQKKRKSGIVGVNYCNTRKKWTAIFRRKHVGYFETEELAKEARLKKEKEYNESN